MITVDRYGDTASTTHTVALIEELESRHIRPGETVALIALASRLEIGIVLLTLDEEMVERYGHSDWAGFSNRRWMADSSQRPPTGSERGQALPSRGGAKRHDVDLLINAVYTVTATWPNQRSRR